MTRPERIQAMRDRLGEIGRASKRFRAALALSNDPAHQRYFKELLDRIDLIIANEALGATRELGGDLSKARQDLRRLQLPELDPDLVEPTPALTALRGERGNLVEALENGVDAARALGLEPRMSEFGELQVPRAAFESTLVRIDERLRNVEANVRGLAEAAAQPATPLTNMAVDQRGFLNLQIASLTVQLGAARLETRTGQDAAIPPESDIAALARTTEAIRDIARDLKATVEELAGWVTPAVRIVGGLVARSAERAAGGVRVLVRVIRRRLQAERPVDNPPEPPSHEETPPPDFDLKQVKRMIVAGQAPPAAWVPFIVELDLRDTKIADLSPLSGLSSLQSLDLTGTPIRDVSPLSRLSSLQILNLDRTYVGNLAPLSSLFRLEALHLTRTLVADVSPLSRLPRLRAVYLSGTRVAAVSPLSGLSRLQTLDLNDTLVADVSPLSGLYSLRSLYLTRTRVADVLPLSGLYSLQSLYLSGTRVADVSPLSSLSSLQNLALDGTPIADVSPLSALYSLQTLTLFGTQVADVSPLSGLYSLQALYLTGTQVADLAPLSGIQGLEVKRDGKTLRPPFPPQTAGTR